MTETTETRTVQTYRHEARRVLTQAREALALRTPATQEVYELLNGPIENILRGQTGVSQEQQVARLAEARDLAEQNREQIAEAVARAQEEVIAAVEAWDFEAALAEAASILAEARDFAAERDFKAHQTEKYARRGYPEDDEG